MISLTGSPVHQTNAASHLTASIDRRLRLFATPRATFVGVVAVAQHLW
jgi:hypothetical protein